MRPKKFHGSLWLLTALVFIHAGCHYYIPVSAGKNPESRIEAIQTADRNGKVFIFRHDSGSYAMDQMQLDQQAQVLIFRPAYLPEGHRHYTQFTRRYRYRKRSEERNVLSEIHIYARGFARPDTVSFMRLPLDSVYRIEVIEHDGPRTTMSYVAGGVGTILGAVTVISVIVLLTKSSCPYVSVFNGLEYEVQGELFGGAIYPQLEREDLVPLRARIVDSGFRVRISNELQEKQFIDFADLLVVEHDGNVSVLPGSDGNLHTVRRPQPPAMALLNDRTDLTESVSLRDDRRCLFNHANEQNLSWLELRFERPSQATEAKLILDMKNSYWLDYLYGRFAMAFGSYYNQWHRSQRNTPAIQLEQWAAAQHFHMTAEIQTPAGWKNLTDIKTVGPLADRMMVIPLEPGDISGNEVRIRLTTGFMFWELNYAAMDFTPDQPLRIHRIGPASAVDEKGNDVLHRILARDGNYLEQPYTGNAAVLHYPFMPDSSDGKAYSVILHTSGYYEHIRNFRGFPRTAFLKQFRSPGAFPAFSRRQYELISNTQLQNSGR